MSRAVPLLAMTFLAVVPAPCASAQVAAPWAASRHVEYYALRLRPNVDLLASLRGFAKDHGLRAAFVASCVGSATRSSVRCANQPSASAREGHFEIVSLPGATFGGHLMEGTTIYTTAEIVLGELADVTFSREPDSTYGYRELVPSRRRGP